MDKCVWPELNEGVINGQTVIYMGAEGLEQQRACQITEQSNYDTALGNAESMDEAIAAFNKLIEKAELHNEYAQNELTRVDDERKSKSFELMGYKGVLALVLIAVAF